MQFGTCDNTNNNHLCEQIDDLEISVAYYIEKSEKTYREMQNKLVGFTRNFVFNETISRHKLEARPKTKRLLTLIPKDCD